jgi:hypothetical protein
MSFELEAETFQQPQTEEKKKKTEPLNHDSFCGGSTAFSQVEIILCDKTHTWFCINLSQSNLDLLFCLECKCSSWWHENSSILIS